LRALAADECIHTPCLSISWVTSDDEVIMSYLLSHGCDCLVAYFPYLSGLSVYRSIAHGIFYASWISIFSVWLAPKAMLSSSIGVGDAPESLHSTFRTVTFIWDSFGRGSDHIILYISSRDLRVSQVTCGNMS
jgi:hypothetical protein